VLADETTTSVINIPTAFPTKAFVPVPAPTQAPSSSKPTSFPTLKPVFSPTNSPDHSRPTSFPTRTPSFFPSTYPSNLPTRFPSYPPTQQASTQPSKLQTTKPTKIPVKLPTPSPSKAGPTFTPSTVPSRVPVTYAQKLNQSQQSFSKFQAKYNLQFSSKAQQLQAQQAFTKNLVDVYNLNNNNAAGSASFGLNSFVQLSPNQFNNMYTGYIGITYLPSSLSSQNLVHSRPQHLANMKVNTNTSVNWAGVYTTSIKDQTPCGSGYIFSAVEQVESDTIRLYKAPTTLSLSEQQVVDCMGGEACSGGDTSQAYTYISNYGLVSSARDPYQGTQEGCKANEQSPIVAKLSTFVFLNNPSEDDLAVYIQNVGPLSVCLATGGWQFYTGGVLTAWTCGTTVNHCAQLVGLQFDRSGNYWIVSHILILYLVPWR